MGLIEIRNRTERLGNLGGVRETDVQTGAARAYAGMADIIAQDGRTNRALADGISGLVDGAKKLAVEFAAAQERRASEEADRFVARFQEGMNAYDNGYTDANGNRVAGAMQATPDDTGAWMDKNVDYRDKYAAKLRKELGMSDRGMEIARKRLVGYNLSTQNRWANRAASLDQARRKADGIARENAATEALMNLDGNSDVTSRLCWQEWKEAGENSLKIADFPKDSPAAKEMMRKRSLGVLGMRLKKRIEAVTESVAGLPPEQAKAAFDQLEGELAEDNIVATLAPDAEFRDGKGNVAIDYIRESLGSAPLSDFAAAAAKDVRIARDRAAATAKAQIAEERHAVADAATRKELELFGDGGNLASYYSGLAELGNDPSLIRTDPARALNLRQRASTGLAHLAAEKEAESTRAARAKEMESKAQIAAEKEDFERQTQYFLVPPDGLDRWQLDEWNVSRAAFAEKVEAAFVAGRIDADDFKSIRSALAKTYDASRVRAINFFDRGFGLDRAAGFNGPSEVGRWLAKGKGEMPDGTDIKPQELAKWRNIYLAELDSLKRSHPSANLDEFARRALDVVKTQYAEEEGANIISMLAAQKERVASRNTAARRATRSIVDRLYGKKPLEAQDKQKDVEVSDDMIKE